MVVPVNRSKKNDFVIGQVFKNIILKRIPAGFFVLGLLLISSCYPEWKMARSYIDSEEKESILVLPADYVFKQNLKVHEVTEKLEGDEWQKDSVLMANSRFLKEVSDSIFLESLINGMMEEFEALGYTVYMEDQLDSFLFIKSPAYIFNIAQIELEEHYTVHKDQEAIDDYVFYKKLDLNAVSYNLWFELTELNNEYENTKLLFASETINDVVSGYFTENIFTGEVKYKYNLNEIDLEVIYRYSDIFARRFAGYTFDYLMNESLDAHWPANKKRRYYMRYNRENNTLDPTWEDKFTVIEE